MKVDKAPWTHQPLTRVEPQSPAPINAYDPRPAMDAYGGFVPLVDRHERPLTGESTINLNIQKAAAGEYPQPLHSRPPTQQEFSDLTQRRPAFKTHRLFVGLSQTTAHRASRLGRLQWLDLAWPSAQTSIGTGCIRFLRRYRLAANFVNSLCHPLTRSKESLKQRRKVQISIQLREVQTKTRW